MNDMEQITKKCSRCGEIKNLSDFSKDNARKDKHNIYCKICVHKISKLWYENNTEKCKGKSREWTKNNLEKVKEWHKNNSDKVEKYRKKYYENNFEKIKEQHKKYCQDNPEKIKESKKKWCKNNTEKIIEYSKEWKKNNPEKVKINRRNYYKNNLEKVKEQNKKWREDNPEKVIESVKKWQENNPEKCKEYDKNYYKNNKEKIKKYYKDNLEKIKEKKKIYQQNNPEKVKEINRKWKKNNHIKINKYCQNRKKIDIHFRLRKNISSFINGRLKRRLLNKNGKSTFSFLPYTVDNLKKHLESLFEPWMNWDNYGYGLGKWVIDHKKPDSLFHYTSVEDAEFKKCWALENLQPLGWKENNEKGNKYLSEKQDLCYNKLYEKRTSKT